MGRYVVSISPSQSRTRILLLDGKDETMRAVLPCGASLHHRRAVNTFLEGLSLWLDSKVHVALSTQDLTALLTSQALRQGHYTLARALPFSAPYIAACPWPSFCGYWWPSTGWPRRPTCARV